MIGHWLATPEMIAKLKARDPEAQRVFWARAEPTLTHLCERILPSAWEANELAVEVMGDFLFRYVHGLTHPEAAPAYLRLMAVRRAREALERRNREAADPIEDQELACEKPLPDEAEGGWMSRRLRECLERLRPKARKVVQLRYHNDLTNEEIGRLVGGTKQYIGRLLGRSLGSLKKCIHRPRPVGSLARSNSGD